MMACPHLDFTVCKVHQLILRKTTSEFTNLNRNKPLRFTNPFLKKHRLMMVRVEFYSKTNRLIGVPEHLSWWSCCVFLVSHRLFFDQLKHLQLFGGEVLHVVLFYPWEKNWGMLVSTGKNTMWPKKFMRILQNLQVLFLHAFGVRLKNPSKSWSDLWLAKKNIAPQNRPKPQKERTGLSPFATIWTGSFHFREGTMICGVFQFRQVPTRTTTSDCDKFPNVERFSVAALCCLKGVELPPVAHTLGAEWQHTWDNMYTYIYIIIYRYSLKHIYTCVYI